MSKLSITVNNSPLDLYPSTSLSIRLSNPALLQDNNSVLPGSFTLPFSAPLTTRNKRLLDLPGNLSSTNFPLFQGITSEIIFDGIPFMSGKIYCSKALKTAVSLHIIINTLHDLKNISLKSILADKTMDIGPSPRAHAKDTALNPDNYNHIFFPLSNQAFYDEVDRDKHSPPGGFGSPVVGWNYQNFWSLSSQEFPESSNHPVAMPFLKLNYILDQIIAHLDISLINEFNTSGEFANLCLYNNYSIYENNEWASSINLGNHVPDLPAADFIKKVTALFAIGFFPSIFSKKITLRTIKEVISSSPAYDWTGKGHFQKEINYNQFPIRQMFFSDEYAEDLRVSYSNAYAPFIPDSFTKVQNMTEFESSMEVGYHYIISRNLMLFKYANGLPGAFFHIFLPYTNPDIVSGTDFESDLIPAQNMWLGTSQGSGISWNVPRVNNPGTSPDFDISNNPPLRLLLYRGMHDASNDQKYPMSSANIFDYNENKIASKSLLWNEEEGLFNSFHKELHNIQIKQKAVSRSYNLSISDLLKFSFDKLVYDENQSYLVQEIGINISPSGLAPSNLKMIKL